MGWPMGSRKGTHPAASSARLGIGKRIFFLHGRRTQDLFQAIQAHGGEAGQLISIFKWSFIWPEGGRIELSAGVVDLVDKI
jgi:hypothetical protein